MSTQLDPQNLQDWTLIKVDVKKINALTFKSDSTISKKAVLLEAYYWDANGWLVPWAASPQGAEDRESELPLCGLLTNTTPQAGTASQYQSNLRYLLSIGVVPEILAFVPGRLRLWGDGLNYTKGFAILLVKKNDQ